MLIIRDFPDNIWAYGETDIKAGKIKIILYTRESWRPPKQSQNQFCSEVWHIYIIYNLNKHDTCWGKFRDLKLKLKQHSQIDTPYGQTLPKQKNPCSLHRHYRTPYENKPLILAEPCSIYFLFSGNTLTPLLSHQNPIYTARQCFYFFN